MMQIYYILHSKSNVMAIVSVHMTPYLLVHARYDQKNWGEMICGWCFNYSFRHFR